MEGDGDRAQRGPLARVATARSCQITTRRKDLDCRVDFQADQRDGACGQPTVTSMTPPTTS